MGLTCVHTAWDLSRLCSTAHVGSIPTTNPTTNVADLRHERRFRPRYAAPRRDSAQGQQPAVAPCVSDSASCCAPKAAWPACLHCRKHARALAEKSHRHVAVACEPASHASLPSTAGAAATTGKDAAKAHGTTRAATHSPEPAITYGCMALCQQIPHLSCCSRCWPAAMLTWRPSLQLESRPCLIASTDATSWLWQAAWRVGNRQRRRQGKARVTTLLISEACLSTHRHSGYLY